MVLNTHATPVRKNVETSIIAQTFLDVVHTINNDSDEKVSFVTVAFLFLINCSRTVLGWNRETRNSVELAPFYLRVLTAVKMPTSATMIVFHTAVSCRNHIQ